MEFQDVFWTEAFLQALTDMTINGWYKSVDAEPCSLHPYWFLRDALTFKDGTVFCGKELLILPRVYDMFCRLHNGNMGIKMSQCHAKKCMYCPGVNQDI